MNRTLFLNVLSGTIQRNGTWRFLAFVASICMGLITRAGPLENSDEMARPSAFTLVSADLADGGRLPESQVLDGFGRHGGNVSPGLKWHGAPAGTMSYVVTVYDPDAPTGSGWWHWVVANIPESTTELLRGAGSGTAMLPKGAVQTLTDFGHPGYGGAAPPRGEVHRYKFTVFALRVAKLEVDNKTSAAMVGFLVNSAKLGQASITVTYGP